MHAFYDHSTHESAEIQTFYFKPEKPVNFVAGQFVELTLSHDPADDRGINRWFTLSNSPTDPLVSITTRTVSDCSSYKRTLQALQKGDRVSISEPMGDFVLPKDRTIPLIFIAGGIGITPFHSILRWLHDKHEARSSQLLHAVSNEDDIIFQETFLAAKVPTTIIVSKPSAAWGGERGALTADHILKLAQPSPNSLIYLAGPEQMTESLTNDLHSLGIQKSRLVTDYFPGYTSY